MVRIRFDLTLDDIVAFNRIYCASSPAVRRQRFYAVCFAVVSGIASSASLAIVTGDALMLVTGGVAATVALLWVPGMLRRNTDRLVRQMYREGQNQANCCAHELEIVDGALVERTPSGESRFRLSAISRIVSDDRYTLAYLSPAAAVIIPRHAVTVGDSEAFVAALHRLWEAETGQHGSFEERTR